MGLQLVKLRGWSWLIERVRIMPAPLLVVVFMILINIHQSGIKNQVSEGFHDLKIILNIECTNACGWELGFIPSFVRLMFECSCVQSVAKTPHLLYQLFLTWSKSLQNLSLQYRCCRLFHVQICEDNVCCPPQGCPALLIPEGEDENPRPPPPHYILSLSFNKFSRSACLVLADRFNGS